MRELTALPTRTLTALIPRVEPLSVHLAPVQKASGAVVALVVPLQILAVYPAVGFFVTESRVGALAVALAGYAASAVLLGLLWRAARSRRLARHPESPRSDLLRGLLLWGGIALGFLPFALGLMAWAWWAGNMACAYLMVLSVTLLPLIFEKRIQDYVDAPAEG